MGDKTKIPWATSTWNPCTGCTRIGPECTNCYAEKMARRLQAMGQRNYAEGFAVRCHEHMLDIPKRWTRSRRIFVCSMGDLFHDEVPTEFIDKVYGVMAAAKQHVYYVLTKRPDRMAEYLRHAEMIGLSKLSHVWHGVSCGCKSTESRIQTLIRIPDVNRFVSFEPLLETDELWTPSLLGVGWVIIGGESGPGARPMSLHVARLLMDFAKYCRIPVFFKQYGSVYARENNLKSRKGERWEDLSDNFRVRELHG